MSEKLYVVDLYSGSHPEKHELFNLDKNRLDGMYYGYVPPHGYIESKFRDRNIDVTKIDKNAKNFVSDVLVVYVKATSDSDKKSDKEIIVDNNYKCLCDESHTTFSTSKGKPYMEGHHLIPCTFSYIGKYSNYRCCLAKNKFI